MVSIIVPVYNAEKWLNKCLDSIINQTYKQLEIILVNDGSKDNSLSICRSYALKDNRIKIIDIPNNGVAHCRNTGLQNAAGDYVLFVDSDDFTEPDMAETLLKEINNSNSEIAVCGSDNSESYIADKIAPEFFVWEQDKVIDEFIKHRKLRGMLWNKLIRRSLFEGLSFDEDIGYAEDAQMMWKVFKRAKRVSVTEAVLYHHTVNPESISNSSFNPVKYDAPKIWKEILSDVEKSFPEKIKATETAYASALLVTLWEMAKAGYSDKEHERQFVKELKKYRKSLNRAEWISRNFKLFANASCACYPMVKLLYKMA